MISFEIPVPEKLRDSIVDGLIDLVSRTVETTNPGRRLITVLDKVRSDPEFQSQLRLAIQKATERFIREYSRLFTDHYSLDFIIPSFLN